MSKARGEGEHYAIGRGDDGLTNRERQVFDGILAGKQLKTIADELGVTKQRVDLIARALEAKGRIKRDAGKIWVAAVTPK